MKPRLLALLFAAAVGVAAGPLPHSLVQNYTQHMQLLDAYPLDHPIWYFRMLEKDRVERVGIHHAPNAAIERERLTGNVTALSNCS